MGGGDRRLDAPVGRPRTGTMDDAIAWRRRPVRQGSELAGLPQHCLLIVKLRSSLALSGTQGELDRWAGLTLAVLGQN